MKHPTESVTEAPPKIYDPRGVVHAEHREIAPRIASLAGLRVGVLDNTKWNGWKVLERTMSLLGEQTHFASVTRYKKESFSVDAEPELIARIAAENDVALIGIGD
ncbi:MAG: hypothetical protein ABI186_09720 [Candidatus Elarobacter sp.]